MNKFVPIYNESGNAILAIVVYAQAEGDASVFTTYDVGYSIYNPEDAKKSKDGRGGVPFKRRLGNQIAVGRLEKNPLQISLSSAETAAMQDLELAAAILRELQFDPETPFPSRKSFQLGLDATITRLEQRNAFNDMKTKTLRELDRPANGTESDKAAAV